MFIVGYIITFLSRLLGTAAGSLVHTLFFILNITSSGGVVPMESMPAFFKIGLGLPFFNAVSGSRTIVLGRRAKSRQRSTDRRKSGSVAGFNPFRVLLVRELSLG